MVEVGPDAPTSPVHASRCASAPSATAVVVSARRGGHAALLVARQHHRDHARRPRAVAVRRASRTPCALVPGIGVATSGTTRRGHVAVPPRRRVGLHAGDVRRRQAQQPRRRASTSLTSRPTGLERVEVDPRSAKRLVRRRCHRRASCSSSPGSGVARRRGAVLEGGSYDTRRGSARRRRRLPGLVRARRLHVPRLAGPGRPRARRTASASSTTTTSGAAPSANGGWQLRPGGNCAPSPTGRRRARGNPGPFGSDPNGTYSGIDAVSRGTTEQRTARGVVAARAGERGARPRRRDGRGSRHRLRRARTATRSRNRSAITARAQVDWPIRPSVSLSAGAEWMREQRPQHLHHRARPSS